MIFDKRKAGVLLPVFSLPSPYGIGTFGKEAYKFVDKLHLAKQSYWQVLPQGPTSYGDSPYQSFSTFAGNPYFVDLEMLIESGLLTREECDQSYFGTNENYIDYSAQYNSRFILLKKAFERDRVKYTEEYGKFCWENGFWLEDYSLFMALKDQNQGKSWLFWGEGLVKRQYDAMENAKNELKEQIEFYKYIQFMFFKQWNNLKAYANSRDIQIIGDIPIYVALDSADVWANPGLFALGEDLHPTHVAGCPPDGFSPTGQLWGNPLYNWQNHRESGYGWWVSRIKAMFTMYDVVRIDHFRGFDEYYAIPAQNETAEKGQWLPGPGLELFERIKQEMGEVKIIAEDLGYITESVRAILEATGYPGMKIMQFAFYGCENGDYVLHNHIKNCVVYTGTHDNQTSRGWFYGLDDLTRKYTAEYVGFNDLEWDKDRFLKHTFSSVSNLVIIPMQDYLDMDDSARINTPSTLGNNWQWRMSKDSFSQEVQEYIENLTKIYYRQ